MTIVTQPIVTQSIERLRRKSDLSIEKSKALFGEIVSGDVSPDDLETILVKLRDKGEKPSEIAGAALALREAAGAYESSERGMRLPSLRADLPEREGAWVFARPDYTIADSCGTGGDGVGSVNISTAVAFVVAAAGLPVAKHGNRSVSSRCGSADVLESIGVKLDASPRASRQALDDANVCFLFAPMYHSGMRHAGPVRKKLGTRTIFNILGPLVNPARPSVQIMGVYKPELCRVAAETLKLMGCERAMVVHGSGMDEVALHGPTQASVLRDGKIKDYQFTHNSFGVPAIDVKDLKGGGPGANAKWLDKLLQGKGTEAHLNCVAANAGALLWVAGKADTVAIGTQQCRELMSRGKPRLNLEELVKISNG